GGLFCSVVLETLVSIIVVWHVHPGQEIAAHIHPHGQDTWTVLSGMADYFQGNGIVRALREGEIAVARPGQVHGARNTALLQIVGGDKLIIPFC
ncbi:cupin domain-containing protein, partial [Escherichia coli]|uniref:cupin domain-containing protein n=1 Tax=Escherichia coli TaxID=562 RepID=UPI001781CDE4|nr:cupin domain-containing protein [Escherichia coli]